jgi:hypothetical protein
MKTGFKVSDGTKPTPKEMVVMDQGGESSNVGTTINPPNLKRTGESLQASDQDVINSSLVEDGNLVYTLHQLINNEEIIKRLIKYAYAAEPKTKRSRIEPSIPSAHTAIENRGNLVDANIYAGNATIIARSVRFICSLFGAAVIIQSYFGNNVNLPAAVVGSGVVTSVFRGSAVDNNNALTELIKLTTAVQIVNSNNPDEKNQIFHSYKEFDQTRKNTFRLFLFKTALASVLFGMTLYSRFHDADGNLNPNEKYDDTLAEEKSALYILYVFLNAITLFSTCKKITHANLTSASLANLNSSPNSDVQLSEIEKNINIINVARNYESYEEAKLAVENGIRKEESCLIKIMNTILSPFEIMFSHISHYTSQPVIDRVTTSVSRASHSPLQEKSKLPPI